MQQRVGLVRALVMNPVDPADGRAVARSSAQTREILQEELLLLMERPDERKTMVFITHSIDEAILLGDRIAVMSARPGRIKEVLDMPFGWPRSADTVRSDPRFAEIQPAHLASTAHRPAAKPDGSAGGRVTTVEQARGELIDPARRDPLRRPGARRARRRRAPASPAVDQSRHPPRIARDRAGAVGGGGLERRPDALRPARSRRRPTRWC